MGFASVSDIDGGNNNLVAATIGGSEPFVSTKNDFVDEEPPVLGSVSGTVTEDTDGDDTGAEPLELIQILLKNEDGDERISASLG